MTNRLLNIIKGSFPLTEIDCGEFAKMKVGGMNFEITAFRAEGLGHVSVMRASGFMGLMKMDTLIINPREIDLPLYSYDRILAMGNDTLITELYDTLVGDYSDESLIKVKDSYTDLAERDPGEHWYDSIKLPSSISKKGKKNHTARLDELTIKHFEAYLASSAAAVTDKAAKQEKAKVYVNGLLEKGGPSTDVFKKSIGEAKTRELFENILFGTK
ncbi:MAG: hypothetical protein IKU99_02635 [Clostridia bacterium]|nr:hypothetical protein [Clostridia bacterium]